MKNVIILLLFFIVSHRSLTQSATISRKAINSEEENNGNSRSSFRENQARNRVRANRPGRLLYQGSYQDAGPRDISFPVFYRRSSFGQSTLGYRHRHNPVQYGDNDDGFDSYAQRERTDLYATKNDASNSGERNDLNKKINSSKDILREDRSLDEKVLLAAQQNLHDDSREKKLSLAANDNNNKYVLLKSSSLDADEAKRGPVSFTREVTDAFSGSGGDLLFVAIVAGCSAAAIIGVVGAGYCFYRIQQHSKAAADVDYPAYGVVGPATKESTNTNGVSPSGDRKLAQSAQMYHYHHQKQQMIASEKAATSRHTSASDVDSDEENEEGDYTVYECPGLAATGEMEVKNPLFQDDVTPVSSPSVVANTNTKEK